MSRDAPVGYEKRTGERIGDRVFDLVVETRHGEITATTAFYRGGLDHTVGGIRLVEKGTYEELGHLAYGMYEKCTVARLPAGGQKSVIRGPGATSLSASQRAEIVGDHVRAVIAEAPGAIFGPDMNINESVLDLVAADPASRRHLAGLSEAWGGLAIDENGYTGVGLWLASEVARQHRPDLGLDSATIQGLGAVGAWVGRGLARSGVAIRAGSVKDHLLVPAPPAGGLPMIEVFEAWRGGGDAGIRALCEASGDRIQMRPDPDGLLEVPAAAFFPAARTTVLATAGEIEASRKENPHVRDVAAFLEKTGVRMVAEGANHPLSFAAEEWLESQGVLVLPDIVCNAGGLVGCFFEWAFRERSLGSSQEHARVISAARSCVEELVPSNTRKILGMGGGCRAAVAQLIADLEAGRSRHGDPLDEWKRGAARWLDAPVRALRTGLSTPPPT